MVFLRLRHTQHTSRFLISGFIQHKSVYICALRRCALPSVAKHSRALHPSASRSMRGSAARARARLAAAICSRCKVPEGAATQKSLPSGAPGILRARRVCTHAPSCSHLLTDPNSCTTSTTLNSTLAQLSAVGRPARYGSGVSALSTAPSAVSTAGGTVCSPAAGVLGGWAVGSRWRHTGHELRLSSHVSRHF